MCVSDGLVVTTGLDGDIRVWDVHPMKRRCARIIARRLLCSINYKTFTGAQVNSVPLHTFPFSLIQ